MQVIIRVASSELLSVSKARFAESVVEFDARVNPASFSSGP